ncbi:MAG: ammonium transporter [Pleurocapsa sp.]
MSLQKSIYSYISLFIIGAILFFILPPALAQGSNANQLEYVNLVWLLLAGTLVFFMNAGFAMLESGLCQTRNSNNVLAKNLIVFCVSILAFWWFGFALMFGDGNSWLGTQGFFFEAFSPPFNNNFPNSFTALQELHPRQSFIAIFFFQLVFAGTTATIVSGAVAERVKFWAFFWFSFCLVGFAYPLVGRWIWGPNGWLGTNLHFLDFAGSTVVHSVGGVAGLVGAILLGPRRGWKGYDPDSTAKNKFTIRPKAFNYYNLTFSTLGCLILWLGWLGFNGGSAQSITHVPHIITTTMIAAGSGGIFVLFLRGLRSRKPTLSSVINGILGGLVGITASSAYVSLMVAMFIGAVSSLCLLSVEVLLDRYKIDDPVGAVPVHLGCGIWGTIAAGLFAHQLPPYINYPVGRIEQIIVQIFGIAIANFTIMVLSVIFWLVIGLIIYWVESFNTILKPEAKDIFPDSRSVSTKFNYSRNFFLKYWHIARKSLRVSATEEAQGNDGTFVN